MRESTNPVLRRIDALLAERGLSRAGASKLAGLSVDYLRKLDESPDRRPHVQKLEALAAVLGVPPLSLLVPDDAMMARGNSEAPSQRAVRADRMTRDVPVLGTAAGAVVGAFQMSSDVIDYVRRPPALIGAADAYALYVEGESMSPRFEPGDLVFVHPKRPISTGDAVILQVRSVEQTTPAAFIKFLDARTPEFVHAHQLNPPAKLRYRREDIVAMHKVLTLRELFGV